MNFITGLFLLRFYFQLVKIPFQHPLGQLVVQLTNFVVKPARRILPSFGKLDTATLLLALIAQWLLAAAIFWNGPMHALGYGSSALLAITATSIFGILNISITGFIIAVLLHVILSWVHPDSPVMPLLHQFTNPVMRYFRKCVPLVGNVDLSPLAFTAGAQFLLYMLSGLQQHLLSYLILPAVS
ncbi:MAG: YggT family protein [Methylophilaceae bacterium]